MFPWKFQEFHRVFDHENTKNFIEFLTKRHINAPEQSTENLLQTFINILSQSRAFRGKFPQRIVLSLLCHQMLQKKLFNNLMFKNSRKREDEEK